MRRPDIGRGEGGELTCSVPMRESNNYPAVVLAVPAYTAADLLKDAAPEVATALGAIRYVSTGTISLPIGWRIFAAHCGDLDWSFRAARRGPSMPSRGVPANSSTARRKDMHSSGCSLAARGARQTMDLDDESIHQGRARRTASMDGNRRATALSSSLPLAARELPSTMSGTWIASPRSKTLSPPVSISPAAPTAAWAADCIKQSQNLAGKLLGRKG